MIDNTAYYKGDSMTHFLYAISNGAGALKVGRSSDVKGRVRALQTGSPTKLELVWEKYAGTTSLIASIKEHKLHRILASHKIMGEWFDVSCLNIIKAWDLNSQLIQNEPCQFDPRCYESEEGVLILDFEICI